MDMNIAGGLPPELAIEQQRIAGRRRMAEALMQRAQQPYQQQMAGGYVTPYSPLQGIAQMLSAYGAGKGIEQSDRNMQGLGQKYNEGVADAVRKYTDAGQPQELPPLTPNDDEGNPMPSATVAPDPRKRVMEALTSPYAPIRQMGMMDYERMQKSTQPIKMSAGDSLIDPVTRQPIVTAPKDPKFHVVAGSLVPEPRGAGGTVAPVFTAPEKPVKTPADDLKALMVASGIDPNSPAAQQIFRQALTKTTTHQPSASNNVTIKQEGAEAQTVGKAFGDQYSSILNAGVEANGKLSRLDRMQGLLDGVNTGKLTPLGTEVAALAESMGIKIDKNLGNKQAAQALSSEIALQLRNPAGGAGMPGAMSDKDREFLVGMTPGLAKTPEGNRLIIETARKLAKRDQDVARLAREYRQKNGSMNEGFYAELQRYADASPLFSTKAERATPSVIDQADAILRGSKRDGK